MAEDRNRARVHARSTIADPRRADCGARCARRVPGVRTLQGTQCGQDRGDYLASFFDGAHGRPDHRVGKWPYRGIRHARRTCRQGWPLCRVVRIAGGGVSMTKRIRSACRRVAACFACLGMALIPLCAAAAPPLHFGNRDTQLTLQANASAPEVLRLASAAGAAWENGTAESLIDQATIDGVVTPLHWRFNRALSETRPASLRLVYDAQNPDLRLYWEWQARAQHGPL